MRTYYWQGLSHHQQPLNGTINAKNYTEAKIKLYLQNITPLKINRYQCQFFKPRIKSDEIALFTQQLAAMLETGISLITALSILINSTCSPAVRNLLRDIKKNLEQGHAFHEALAQHPRYFNALICALVQAGEQSGTLALLLKKLALHNEKKRCLIQKIKKAMTYPLAVIIIAILITTILLTQVIPQFETLFQQTHVQLPTITQWILNLSSLLQKQGVFIVLFILLFISGFMVAYRNLPKVRWITQQGSLNLPFLGHLIQKTMIARFCQTFSIMTQARMPLPQTLEMLANTCGNLVFQQQISSLRERIINGDNFHIALQTAPLFPALIQQLVAVGEETGELAAMMGQAAQFYEQTIETTVDQLNTLLEPLIMIILGILIGGLIIAMYLPIFKIGQII